MINRPYFQLVLVALAGLCVPLSWIQAQKNPHKSKSLSDSVFADGIAAIRGRTLLVRLETGGSFTVRGWDRDSVHLRAHLAGRDWRDTKLHLDRFPNGTRLRTGLGGSQLEKSTSHEFELWVPRNYDIDLESAGGDLHIENVNGTFRGQTRGGSIELEHVRGTANLSTRGGNIRIVDSRLEGRVTTRGGAIERTRVTGGVRALVETDSLDDKKKRTSSEK